MYADRQRRLREKMATAGMDAVFVANPKNVNYLTGFHAMMPGDVQPLGDPEGMVLVQKDRCDLLCDGRYIAGARQLKTTTAVQIESPTTAATFAAKINELIGNPSATIGFEQDALVYGDGVGLMREGNGLTWKPAEGLLAELRVCKTPDEIAKIRKAQAITGDCFEHIRGWIRVGMTERQVALEIETFLRTNSEGNSFSPIVAFGETGCHPHYSPSATRTLARNQSVLLDFGGIYEGYCGDMTRMLFVGTADDRYREVYHLVLEAQQRCLDGIKPGVTGHALDALCRDFFASKGCDAAFQHGTGHGIGLAVHEEPRLKKTIQTVFEPGMVFSVEPGLYYEGWGGVRIEDLVVMTASGHENLTTTTKELVEIAG